jgi:hypothetical protein
MVTRGILACHGPIMALTSINRASAGILLLRTLDRLCQCGAPRTARVARACGVPRFVVSGFSHRDRPTHGVFRACERPRNHDRFRGLSGDRSQLALSVTGALDCTARSTYAVKMLARLRAASTPNRSASPPCRKDPARLTLAIVLARSFMAFTLDTSTSPSSCLGAALLARSLDVVLPSVGNFSVKTSHDAPSPALAMASRTSFGPVLCTVRRTRATCVGVDAPTVAARGPAGWWQPRARVALEAADHRPPPAGDGLRCHDVRDHLFAPFPLHHTMGDRAMTGQGGRSRNGEAFGP